MKRPRIVVVGSSNTDMVVKADHLPRPGETVAGGSFLVVQGGKGANQAVAAARLGGDVVLVARLGNDMFARDALDGFNKAGLNTRFVKMDPNHSSGVALIMVDQNGENTIAVASGANHHLKPEDVEAAESEIAAADIVVSQLEIPEETLECAARLATRHGVPMLLDPAPAANLPDSLIRQFYCIKPNEHEAQQLTGIEVKDYDSATEAAQVLIRRGVKNVIITMGPLGSLLLRDNGKRETIPAKAVNVVDTTAAGDAYCGALAFALGQKRDLIEAAIFANNAAAISVTRLGAQPSLPTGGDVYTDFT